MWYGFRSLGQSVPQKKSKDSVGIDLSCCFSLSAVSSDTCRWKLRATKKQLRIGTVSLSVTSSFNVNSPADRHSKGWAWLSIWVCTVRKYFFHVADNKLRLWSDLIPQRPVATTHQRRNFASKVLKVPTLHDLQDSELRFHCSVPRAVVADLELPLICGLELCDYSSSVVKKNNVNGMDQFKTIRFLDFDIFDYKEKETINRQRLETSCDLFFFVRCLANRIILLWGVCQGALALLYLLWKFIFCSQSDLVLWYTVYFPFGDVGCHSC